MKKTILGALMAFTTLVQPAFAQSSNQVYLYTLDLKNASESLSGKWEFDLPSMQVAMALKQAQPNSCIDIRSLGSASTGALRTHGTIGIVMNSKLTMKAQVLIKQSICENSPGGCVVSIAEQVFPLDSLSIDTYVDTGTMFSSKPGVHSLQGKGMIPQFSAACDTGRHRDSWNDAASTPEARAYLNGLGIDISSVRTLDLGSNGKGSVYTFGFPRH